MKPKRPEVTGRLVLPSIENTVSGGLPPWAWYTCSQQAGGYTDVVPEWDVNDHFFGETCACEPIMDTNGLLVHNAFDGRERYERGTALRH